MTLKINDKPIVRQSNELIEASYKIATLGETRLIRLLISQIHPEDEDFKPYRIRVSDFASMFGLSDQDGRLYELIEKASESLTKRQIAIKNGKDWLYMSWLSSAKYKHGSGYVQLRFDVELKPYLLQLKGYFTQYKLENTFHFKSLYSIRIFELLKKEEFKADSQGYFKRTFEYDELREKLGIEKEYSSFADFRRYIVATANKEISENSDIVITQIDYPKTGRKVTHIVFHCEKKPKEDNHSEEGKGKPETLPDDVRELISMGIDEHIALQWRKKYGVKRLIRNITYTKTMHKAGKIRDSLTGFLATAITKNMGGADEFKQQELEKKRKAIKLAEETKEKAEEDERKRSHEHYNRLMAEFERVPKEAKQEIREAFEQQLDPAVLHFWKLAKKRVPESPESQITVKALFLNFFQSVQVSENGQTF